MRHSCCWSSPDSRLRHLVCQPRVRVAESDVPCRYVFDNDGHAEIHERCSRRGIHNHGGRVTALERHGGLRAVPLGETGRRRLCHFQERSGLRGSGHTGHDSG